MTSDQAPLAWFEGFGIELEWMVVDARTLAVEPMVDRVLSELAGGPAMEVELGPVAWSNELALHVIELKTNGPTEDLERAAKELSTAVQEMDARLRARGARLMPTGMHPFMQPEREFRLWPTDEEGIYGTFDRIFDCRGHGWSNLQSMHLNLPFANDAEFARLHDAVRVLLPILPALAASSPLVEGRWAPNLDQRLVVYRGNAAKVFEVSGHVVPERVRSRVEYQSKVLAPIYRALAPFDPEGVLAYEWVNARGAIARFDRSAIEIRVLDTQESVTTNLAVAHGVSEVLRLMVTSAASPGPGALPEERLSQLLFAVARDAERTVIDDGDYLHALGFQGSRSTAQELWQGLLERVPRERRAPALWPALEAIVAQGCLARRIRTALAGSLEHGDIVRVYTALCDCLANDAPFSP